jgi:cellulose synthase/poly-beta-1,6-N-acetylglucosamine synthase-like glycosyltransferase
MRYLKNQDLLSQYKGQVIFCTREGESQQFQRELKTLAQRIEAQVVETKVDGRPSPWELLHTGVLASRKRLCLFLDGDTWPQDDLSLVAGNLKADVASLKVTVRNRKHLIAKMQQLEYSAAMENRKVYPWLTSGAAMIGRREVLLDILSRHSFFFNGGDIEIGKLAVSLGYAVEYLPFEFQTEAPDSVKAWLKQRKAWFCGGFRHAIVNMWFVSPRYPLFFFYNTVVVYGLAPMRLADALLHPLYLPFVLGFYGLLAAVIYWKEKPVYFALLPLYFLAQLMIALPLGVLMYLSTVKKWGNVGIISKRRDRSLSNLPALAKTT